MFTLGNIYLAFMSEKLNLFKHYIYMHIYIIYTCVMYITYDLIKILKHRQVEDGHQGRSTKSPFTTPWYYTISVFVL